MNLSLIVDALRVGSSVADPKTWKVRSLAVAAISGAYMVISHALQGTAYAIPVDQATADAVATTVATVAGMFHVFGTTDKIGLLPAKPDDSNPPASDMSGRA